MGFGVIVIFGSDSYQDPRTQDVSLFREARKNQAFQNSVRPVLKVELEVLGKTSKHTDAQALFMMPAGFRFPQGGVANFSSI